MTVLYHISTDLKHDGKFEPRVPAIRTDGEDNELLRSCWSTSIEGSLSAIPNGGSRLDELMEWTRGYFKIFRIDTEKYGISKEDIIDSDKLYESGLVPDARITGEYWITSFLNVEESDSFIIKLDEWDEEAEDVVPSEICRIAEEDYDGDYFEAYMDKYDDYLPCMVNICNATYFKSSIKKGEEYHVSYLESEEVDTLVDMIGEIFSETLEIVENYGYSLKFKANRDVDLSELFIAHKNEYC